VLDREPFRFGHAPDRVETFSPLRPAADYGRDAARVLEKVRRRFGARVARPQALYGYEAARLVLRAVEEGGEQRAAVLRAARTPEWRRSPIGRYRVTRSGDVSGGTMTLYRLENGLFQPVSEVPATPR
jgi:ABC-type branched-subunit amino acid transport system substrate-binding protein